MAMVQSAFLSATQTFVHPLYLFSHFEQGGGGGGGGGEGREGGGGTCVVVHASFAVLDVHEPHRLLAARTVLHLERKHAADLLHVRVAFLLKHQAHVTSRSDL